MTTPQFGAVVQPVASIADTDAPAEDELMFEVAAFDYLTRTDAFLSLFRSEARSGTADMEVAGWARDLLTTARLMIDSPMADDPNLKELLEDLELILVQIAQYRSGVGTDELDFIEQGLEERSLLLRIQAALGGSDDVTLRQGAI
jgi:hypothetical protein